MDWLARTLLGPFCTRARGACYLVAGSACVSFCTRVRGSRERVAAYSLGHAVAGLGGCGDACLCADGLLRGMYAAICSSAWDAA